MGQVDSIVMNMDDSDIEELLENLELWFLGEHPINDIVNCFFKLLDEDVCIGGKSYFQVPDLIG